MRVELLVVPSCPNQRAAEQVLDAAAGLAGVTDLEVTLTVIDTDEQAQRRGFVGSPTFLIDGVDPFAAPGSPTGLACRLYATSSGLGGVPDVLALRDALLTACVGPTSATGHR